MYISLGLLMKINVYITIKYTHNIIYIDYVKLHVLISNLELDMGSITMQCNTIITMIITLKISILLVLHVLLLPPKPV